MLLVFLLWPALKCWSHSVISSLRGPRDQRNTNVCSSCPLRPNICVLCGVQPGGCAGCQERSRAVVLSERMEVVENSASPFLTCPQKSNGSQGSGVAPQDVCPLLAAAFGFHTRAAKRCCHRNTHITSRSSSSPSYMQDSIFTCMRFGL